MRINHFPVLVLQSEFLNQKITGLKISDIYTQEKNKLVLELNNGSYLEFSIEKNYEYLVLREGIKKSNKNVVSLFEEIYNEEIKSVSVLNDDRFICLYLSNGYKIIFKFFTNKANCYLLKDNLIINVYKTEPEVLNSSIKIFINEYNKNNFDEIDKPQGFFLHTGNKIKISFVRELKENEEYENINELLINYIKFNKKFERENELKNRNLKIYNDKIKKLKSKIENLQIQLQKSKTSDDFMNKGNLILSNIYAIKKGDAEFIANDITIKLNTELTPAENAAKYFEKYKNLKKSSGILSEKINNAKSELRKVESELLKFSEGLKMNSNSEFKKMEKKIKSEDKKDETSKFRKFVIDESNEVWVGKDSVSNDLLTMKYTHPEDLWFHVRGASGSHTILKRTNKKENPAKHIIEIAASIAAYYSKARNGKNIPVAYCEKKFVKKKKGFKSGSVIMEREKVVFVNPKIPD
ncbi:MAG: DUF814 domain-containing protein [Ignavibacteria bacterium]|nr:DUF814 domain-containing protein [Ignavibacteria bacterium]